MIGMRTILEVADNSGARRLSCILPRGGDLGLRAGLGDVITASVKEASPDGQIKKGKVDFRVDKAGVVHAVMGKRSFGGEKLAENILAFIDKLIQLKPSTSKGIYLRAISVSSTMGPGFKVDPLQVRTLIKAA